MRSFLYAFALALCFLSLQHMSQRADELAASTTPEGTVIQASVMVAER